MQNNFINSENASVVMAWCAVGTLAIGLGMTIYQIVQQQRQTFTFFNGCSFSFKFKRVE